MKAVDMITTRAPTTTGKDEMRGGRRRQQQRRERERERKKGTRFGNEKIALNGRSEYDREKRPHVPLLPSHVPALKFVC
jgi:hypothetical protein